MPDAAGNWWESFFDDCFADLVLEDAGSPPVRAAVDFLVDRLGLGPGSRVFDQCCGTGRLSLPLARRGVRVVGVDLMDSYVRRARAKAEGLPCEFHAGDAFTFVPAGPCDGAFNWFTSFGYTPDDGKNRRMMERAFEALRPGGRFALDYVNLAWTMRHFQACLLGRHPTGAGEFLVVRETSIDWARGMFEQRWTYLAPEGRRAERRGETKMYLPHELGGMLRACGFVGLEFHGSTAGEPLGLDSPRCILVARKPG
jgi:SAM-dependent methyltransferase